MTNEKLKTAIANINAYLSESPADDDTVTLTVNVIRSVEEFMSEINSMNIEEALKNAEKCLEAFTSEDIIKQQQETIESQKAEIERLKDYPKCVYEYDGDITDYCLKTPCPNYKTVDAIRAEAVKEFAERLKEKLHLNGAVMGSNCAIVNDVDIDNLVKEMVGEEK